jgi:hypothetical protein
MNTLFNANEYNGEQTEDKIKYNKDPYLETIHWDFVSLLYKSARIGDAFTAIVCAEVIRQIKGEYRVILILNQLIGEDVHPLYYSKIQPVINAYTQTYNAKIDKSHNLSQSTYLVAKSPKWYMDNIITKYDERDYFSGSELEEARQYISTDIKIKKTPEALMKFVKAFKFPTWTYDRHTRAGLKAISQGTADTRLDGGWDNRYNVKKHFDDVVKKCDKDIPYSTLIRNYVNTFYGL